MTRAEHFRIAEIQLAEIENRDVPVDKVMAYATAALAHATLAAVPFTYETP